MQSQKQQACSVQGGQKRKWWQHTFRYVEKELGITGGIAKNQGVVKRLTKKLGIESVEQQWCNEAYDEKAVPFDTQIADAVGAALFGKSLAEKGGK